MSRTVSSPWSKTSSSAPKPETRSLRLALLEKLPLEKNSDNFLFDNQILAQIIGFGYPIGEITCPTKYFPEASCIGFGASVRYGFGCIATAWRWRRTRRRSANGK